MKFNMGCGHNKKPGYVNVDAFSEGGPDQVVDLETLPWPWADNTADEMVFNHSLEHMGGDPKIFLGIMKEIYRVSKPDGVVQINVPHPRHDDFLNDPTHVRPVTAEMMALFDRSLNDKWKEIGAANSPLAHYTGVDFETVNVQNVIEETYLEQYQSGAITVDQIVEYVGSRLNVVKEIQITLKVRKAD